MSKRPDPLKLPFLTVPLAALLLVSSGPSLAPAATITWDGDTSSLWTTGANWSSGSAPLATDLALFNGLGAGSPISFSAITLGATPPATGAGSIQFGETTQTTGSSIPSYTLGTIGSSTITVNSTSAGVAGFLNYYGTANTANHTINANIVFAANGSYQINNDSGGGNLVLAGNISTLGTVDGTSLFIGDTGAGNSGNVVLQGNTYTLGNNATRLGSRLQVGGDRGALVFNNTTGISVYGGPGASTNYPIWLNKGRSSANDPHVVFASGNNIVESGNAAGGLVMTTASGAGNHEYFIRADAGATVAVGTLYAGTNNNPPSGFRNHTAHLYGGGTGVVYAGATVRQTAGNTMNVIKDGTGSWAITAPGVANTYNGGTTIRNGTFLAMGNGSTGTGAVLVDKTGSLDGGAAAPIFGGTGTVLGAVTVKNGGTITAGGAATGGATAYATITSPIGNIGNLTLSNSLTGEAGAVFSFDLNSNGAFLSGLGSSDKFTLTTAAANALNLAGATLSLNDLGNTTLQLGDYFTLMSYNSGVWNGTTFAGLADGASIIVGSNEYSINYGSTETTLNWVAAVPEPSTWTMLLGGYGLFFAFGRFRGNRSLRV